MICPKCGKTFSDDCRFCTHCGSRLEPDTSDDWVNDIEVEVPVDKESSDDWVNDMEVSVPVEEKPKPQRVRNDYTAPPKEPEHVYTRPHSENHEHINMGLPDERYDEEDDFDEKPLSFLTDIRVYIGLGALAIIAVVLAIIVKLRDSSGFGELTTVSDEITEADNIGEIEIVENVNTDETVEDQADQPSEETGDENEEVTDTETEEKKLIDDPAVHTYELVVGDVSWTEAYEQCLSKGGHLVRISSDEEFQAILNQINSEGKDKIKFWIGGARDNEDNYRWVFNDNYDERANLEFGEEIINSDSKYSSYWLSGEPSLYDQGTQTVEDRMNMFYMKSQNRWVWNDVPDDVLSIASFYSGVTGYICEYE